MDQSAHIGDVSTQRKLNSSSQCEPPALHTEGHEAGAQHRHTHVYVQVRHLDIRLSADETNVTLNFKNVKPINKTVQCYVVHPEQKPHSTVHSITLYYRCILL